MRHARNGGPGARFCRIARDHEHAAVAEIAERVPNLTPMIGLQLQRRMLEGDAVDVLLAGKAFVPLTVTPHTLLLMRRKFGLMARRLASSRRTRSMLPSVQSFFSVADQVVH